MTAPQVRESTQVIRGIMEFIRLHASPGGFDPQLAERRVNARLEQIEAAACAPIDMVLHCPSCGLQHIDVPEPAWSDGAASGSGWDNPPHKSHLCRTQDGGCGFIWRPADVPTNGVQALKSSGKNDSPIKPPLGAFGVDIRLGTRMYIDYSQHYRNGTIQLTIKRKTR